MAIIIDNIEIDDTNYEFRNAAEFVNNTDRNVFLTGKAGTGKTTFLKFLRETTIKNTVILASTGVAAVNAGGQTINSFFKIKPSVFIPNDARLRLNPDPNDTDKSTIYDHFTYSKEKLSIIRELELLIIDEVSMVRCDMIDLIDQLLRIFRNKKNELFGGVQVILIGDTFQLAPIAKHDEWAILKEFYKTEFFFGAKAFENNKLVYIELKKIYRQKEEDFIDLLNKVRINEITQLELDILNAKYNPTFLPEGNHNYITLATHKQYVNETNSSKLSELESDLKIYNAELNGIFPDNILPTERQLQLKIGAQVMFVKNDKGKKFFNGKIGKVKMLGQIIVIELSDGDEISVEKEVWNNIKFRWNEKEKKVDEDIIGTFKQFPLKLAWAITVHKSQGLTFEKVIADLGHAFTAGQVYVALSRCTTFHGLVLKTKIERSAIYTDPAVLLFAQNELPDTLIIKELNTGKADHYYKKSREFVKLELYDEAFENLLKAIRYRNDTETIIFKRYFIAIASRLASHKKILEERIKELIEINIIADGLSNFNTNLQNEIQYYEQKVKEQNSGLKLLMDKLKENEVINEELNHQLYLGKIEKKLLLEDSLNLKKDLDRKNLEIIQFKKDLSFYLAENKRLSNIKWYQKLLGYR